MIRPAGVAGALFLSLLLGGCASSPPPPTAAPQVEETLATRARAAVDWLLEPLQQAHPTWPHPDPRGRVRVVVQLRPSTSDALSKHLEPELLAALHRRVSVLVAEDDRALTEALACEQQTAAYDPERRVDPGSRQGATHALLGDELPTDREDGGGFVHLRLIDVQTGLVVSSTVIEVAPRPAPERPPAIDPEWGPLELTRAILAAAHGGDGTTITWLLHPELARSWERAARRQRLTLDAYALRYFSSATLDALGPVTELELKPGVTRAEVEVEFAHKTRDVDFGWRLASGRWRLLSVGDYP
jgi:hypothetical protein